MFKSLLTFWSLVLLGKLNIVICVESGLLEKQAILFIKSVKRFFQNTEYQIHAYSPRINSHPGEKSLAYFQSNGVKWCSEAINESFHDYPIANKVLAFKHFEILNDKQIYLRPVDNKGPGSESENDPNDGFWQAIYHDLGVSIPKPMMKTTVKATLIRSYFNAGLVWSNGVKGFFQQWYDDFIQIVNSGLRPFGYKSRDGDDFRCLDQVALAVTTTRFLERVKVLPKTYNYPIPFRPILDKRIKLDDLVHVHYHKWFQHPDFLKHVCNEYDQSTPVFKWLSEQLPLKPLIEADFKC